MGTGPAQDPAATLARIDALGLNALLAMLVSLDGAAEAAVTRDALRGGVPVAVVADELRRELTRRVARSADWYDERGR